VEEEHSALNSNNTNTRDKDVDTLRRGNGNHLASVINNALHGTIPLSPQLPPQNLPLSQIFPTTDSLLASDIL